MIRDFKLIEFTLMPTESEFHIGNYFFTSYPVVQFSLQSLYWKLNDDNGDQTKPLVKKNSTTGIWNYMLLVDIYFCNNNSKALVCHNIGAFFPSQSITSLRLQLGFVLFQCQN